MGSINLGQGMSSTQSTTLLCLLAGAICTCLLFYPTTRPKPTSSPAERTSDPTRSAKRGVYLKQIKLDRGDADTDIDTSPSMGLI